MKDMKEKIKRNFSKSAKKYNDYALLHRQITKKLLESISEKDYKYVLDIGTGTGLLTFGLAERFKKAKIYGIDIAPGMIEHARAKSPYQNIQFQEGDGEKIPFADQTFDLVVSSSSFQWMDPKKCFKDCFRVLKSGGLFEFSFFGPKTLKEMKSILGDRSYIKYPDLKELKSVLKKIGFTNINLSSEIKNEVFPDFMTLLRFIKGLGAQSSKVSLGFESRKVFAEAEKEYNSRYRAPNGVFATFEVIYGSMTKE